MHSKLRNVALSSVEYLNARSLDASPYVQPLEPPPPSQPFHPYSFHITSGPWRACRRQNNYSRVRDLFCRLEHQGTRVPDTRPFPASPRTILPDGRGPQDRYREKKDGISSPHMTEHSPSCCFCILLLEMRSRCRGPFFPDLFRSSRRSLALVRSCAAKGISTHHIQ